MTIHDQLIDAGKRALSHDPDPWAMLDAEGKLIRTPCCNNLWRDPILFTASCGRCFKPHRLPDLGVHSFAKVAGNWTWDPDLGFIPAD